MSVINQATCKLFTDTARFTQLAGYYEEERRTVWMMLRAQPRPCFNHALIEEIMNLSWLVRQSGFVVDFWVTGSLVPDMYNAGGDLRFFVECIQNGRREALRAYARACVDCVHAASRGFIPGPFRWLWWRAAHSVGALKPHWPIILFCRSATLDWDSLKLLLTCFPVWGAIHWSHAARA